MQFIPNETQVMLRDSVQRFVDKDYDSDRKGTLGHDAETWAFFAEQGWLAAGVSEEAGGLGGDIFDTCLIATELGRGLVREAYVPVVAVTAQLLLDLAPQDPLVEGLLWGGERPLLAHAEAAARGDSGWIETRAVTRADGFALSGSKSSLLGGPAATALLVSCRIDDDAGMTLFAIDPAAAGVERQDYRTVDNRGAANLRLDAVSVDPGRMIGPRGGADAAIARALDHGLVASAAEAVGAMDAALSMTRDYLKTRKQFGVPIGDFQALRHVLADMFIETEQARSIVLRAVAALQGSDAREASRLAAAVKIRVGKAGYFVGGKAIQLHGGIGVTEEYGVGQYYKRLVMFDMLMGTGAMHLERFSAQPG